MGLFGAMTSSVSGLNTQGEAIGVISDNLSNTNTIGYKATRALFEQMVTSSGVGGTRYNSGGVGSVVQRDQKAQGSLISSSNVTDLALSGNGFFRVADSQAITTSTSFYYTRAGSFLEDKDGYLVNPQGYFLQGWRTDADGNIANLQSIESIELQSVGVSAQATDEVALGINLTSTETLNSIYDTTTSLAADLANIATNPTSADYLTDVRLFDAQGGARDVTFGFTKRAANLWDYTLYTDGSNIEGGTPGTNTVITIGTLRFATDGSLKHATGLNFTADWSGGVSDGAISLNMGDYTGGQIATAGAGLTFTDDVLDISVENESLANGVYDVVFTGANTVELQQGGVPVEAAITVSAATATREIYFPTSGVRMTVSSNFNAAPGAYPNTLGSFTVSTAAPFDEGQGTDGVIQFAADYNTSFISQTGFGSGTLASIQVDEEGFISGTFTNGETKRLFKVAIGVFQNPAGLEPVSGTLLRVTDNSGPVLIKQAGVGGTATVVSGALEGSTTDIANEFSQMIVAQRSFQANSTVISTVDQMLNELLQLR